jgi:uncharacterized protein YlaN (UPF0358 family)
VKAKHPFWNNIALDSSGAEIRNLLRIKEFEVSMPKCPTENGDVLDTVRHKNVELSEIVVS